MRLTLAFFIFAFVVALCRGQGPGTWNNDGISDPDMFLWWPRVAAASNRFCFVWQSAIGEPTAPNRPLVAVTTQSLRSDFFASWPSELELPPTYNETSSDFVSYYSQYGLVASKFGCFIFGRGLLCLSIPALAQETTTTQVLRIGLNSGALTYRFNPNVASSALSQLRLDTTSKLNVAASASGSNPATLIKFSNNGLKRVSEVKPDSLESPTSLAFDALGNSYVGATYSDACNAGKPRIFVFGISGSSSGWCDYPTASEFSPSLVAGADGTSSGLSFNRELVYNLTSESTITDMRNTKGVKVTPKGRNDGFDTILAGTHVYVSPLATFGVSTFFNAGPGCEIVSHYFLHDIGLNSSYAGNSVFTASTLNGRPDVLQRTLGDGLALSPDGSRLFAFGAVTVGVNHTYLGIAPGGNLTDDHVLATFNRTQKGGLELLSLTLVRNSGDFVGLEALSNTQLLSYAANSGKFVNIAAADGTVTDRFRIPSADKIMSVTDFTMDRFDNIWVAAQWSSASAASSSVVLLLIAAALSAFLRL